MADFYSEVRSAHCIAMLAHHRRLEQDFFFKYCFTSKTNSKQRNVLQFQVEASHPSFNGITPGLCICNICNIWMN